MNALWVLFILLATSTASGFEANDQSELECFTHYKDGETSVHEYSGRYYALIFTRIPGSESIRQVNGYVYNPIGDIAPMTGTELTIGYNRVISITGILRQFTQPWIDPPQPYYNIMRHITLPTDGSVGQVETANDNKMYQPTIDGKKVPRGNDGVGLFNFAPVSCAELPKVRFKIQ
jgi:hypothetical protein